MRRPFSVLPLLFVTVLWGGWLHCPTVADHRGLCRRIKFSTWISGYALKYHVIKNLSLFPVPSIRSACKNQCIMDPVCVSVNIGPPTKEKFICELSDSDHIRHPKDVKRREGFMYMGPEDNPCSSDPCLHDSTCLNGYTDKQYLCECQAGYTGEHCEKDIDECTLKMDNCSLNAMCSNTKGSFNCYCKPGFYGNETSCTDIDECAIKTDNCSLNAMCKNTEGSFNCTCKPGFTGSGISCTDIDECAMKIDNCSIYTFCNNTEGSFNCTCKNQFRGNGNNLTAFTAVFTNLGATGRNGPTSLGSHYTGQDHDGQVTLSSGIQQWTVLYTGEYRIEAIGAAGGYDTHSNSAQYRGRGARMIGTFSLCKDEIIQILVGQEGGINSDSFSSGGGGGTFVVRGSKTSLIIAGGGGGIMHPYSRHAGCDANTSTTGNPGYRSWSGGSNGHGAQVADDGPSGGGGGGFYSSGRSGKNFNGTKGWGGEGGKGFLQGGVGGRAWYNTVVGGFGGGGGAAGGGGGYSGGSSGNGPYDSCGGGGGSFNSGTNQQNECCYNTAGHGNVTITFLP